MTPDVGALLREATSGSRPVLVALVGSNGAGKSTYFGQFLEPTGIEFLNADVVARMLNPAHPEAAAYDAMRIVESRRLRAVAERRSFCFETVLSDPVGEKVRFLRQARASGYLVVVIFIWIPSVAYSALRVGQRVRDGGHRVPLVKIRDRFPRTQANVREALASADLGLVLDNASRERPFTLMEVWQQGTRIEP